MSDWWFSLYNCENLYEIQSNKFNLDMYVFSN